MSVNVTKGFTRVTTYQEYDLGHFTVIGGIGYTYVYNAGADATAVADVVQVFDTTLAMGHVSVTAATTLANSDGTTAGGTPAGVAVSVMATTTYGWLWSWGHSLTNTITTDGNVVAGPMAVLDTAKIAVLGVPANHHCKFGISTAADSSTTATGAILFNCMWAN